nr:MAG TPA: hypothetical protein [Caudoviricetes sp.]
MIVSYAPVIRGISLLSGTAVSDHTALQHCQF